MHGVARVGEAGSSTAFEFAADLLARFNFGGSFDGDNYPCVSHAQQTKFRTEFVEQLAKVRTRLHEYEWLAPAAVLPPRATSGLYRPRTDFHVFVSDVYQLSKSLVPAWCGQRGWMEFPAYRVVAGNASVAHEIVHVLFPNGNRMLAEGLAVYLQYKLFPEISVYPNFGEPLDDQVAVFLINKYADTAVDVLWDMNLDAFENISTPDELGLTFGEISIGARPGFGTGPNDEPIPFDEGKAVYQLAGSLVGFLLDNPIADGLLGERSFGELYTSTPLRPLERDPGAPDRWQACYKGRGKSYSFTDLGLLWKTYMHVKFVTAGKNIPIPANYLKKPLVADLYKRLKRKRK
jgi:hypothetical protein